MRRPSMIVATVGVIVLILFAAFGPLMAPRSAESEDWSQPPGSSPSVAHRCGTTSLSNDVCSQALEGYRYDLQGAFAALALTALAGAAIGAVAGCGVPLVSTALQVLIGKRPRVYRFLIPTISRFVAVVAFAYGTPFIPTLTLVLGVFTWRTYARIVQAAVRAARAGQRALARDWLALLPVQMALYAWVAVLAGAWLGPTSIGLARVSSAEWGMQLYYALNETYTFTWWAVLFPTLALASALLVLALAARVIRQARGEALPPVWHIWVLLRRSRPLRPACVRVRECRV